MKARALVFAIAAITAAVAPIVARADEALRNWFDDPFFQITSADLGCPLPAGPFISEADKRVQAHRRAEKGTTCWLARECDRPNAYAYDHDIAAALQAAVRTSNPFPGTTLWATVQGRVVYVEGCAGSAATAAQVEAYVRALPHVQQVIAILRSDASAAPPYRVRFAGHAGPQEQRP